MKLNPILSNNKKKTQLFELNNIKKINERSKNYLKIKQN